MRAVLVPAHRNVPLEFPTDQGFELFIAKILQRLSVDEKSWRAGDIQDLGIGHVLFDVGKDLSRAGVLAGFPEVQAGAVHDGPNQIGPGSWSAPQVRWAFSKARFTGQKRSSSRAASSTLTAVSAPAWNSVYRTTS